MTRFLGAGVVAALVSLGGAAAAETSHWRCQDGREFPGSLASSSELRSFEMVVRPDGTVEGAGTVQVRDGGAFRYSFAGRWQLDGDMFAWVAQSSINGAQMEFQSRVLDGGRMSSSWVDPTSGGRVTTICQRLG